MGSHLIWFSGLKSLASHRFGTKLRLCGYLLLVCLLYFADYCIKDGSIVRSKDSPTPWLLPLKNVIADETDNFKYLAVSGSEAKDCNSFTKYTGNDVLRCTPTPLFRVFSISGLNDVNKSIKRSFAGSTDFSRAFASANAFVDKSYWCANSRVTLFRDARLACNSTIGKAPPGRYRALEIRAARQHRPTKEGHIQRN